jgi:hypothetical protein
MDLSLNCSEIWGVSLRQNLVDCLIPDRTRAFGRVIREAFFWKFWRIQKAKRMDHKFFWIVRKMLLELLAQMLKFVLMIGCIWSSAFPYRVSAVTHDSWQKSGISFSSISSLKKLILQLYCVFSESENTLLSILWIMALNILAVPARYTVFQSTNHVQCQFLCDCGLQWGNYKYTREGESVSRLQIGTKHNRFMGQRVPIANGKHFFRNILCIESFCPQKRTRERCTWVLYSSSMVAILTTETTLWTCACASAT